MNNKVRNYELDITNGSNLTYKTTVGEKGRRGRATRTTEE